MPVMFISIFYNTPRFFELEVYQLQPGDVGAESSIFLPAVLTLIVLIVSIVSLLIFFLDFKSFYGCGTEHFCLASTFHFSVVFSRQSQSTVFAEEVENIFLPKIIISPINSTPSLFGERFIINAIMENAHFRFLLFFLFHCFLIYICIGKASEQFLFSWQKK